MRTEERQANDLARQRRAAARGANMTAAVLNLGDVASESAPGSTPTQRVEQVAELTMAAWAMTGQPWPRLPRSAWPVRVLALGDPG